MRKHRSYGITLAAIVAAGLALTRAGTNGTAFTDAAIAFHVGTHHTAVQAAHVEPRATPNRRGFGWRNVAQSVTFNSRGGITTEPDITTPPHGTARPNRALINSDMVAQQEHQHELAAFFMAVQTNEQQQFLTAMYYQQALYDLQQLAIAVDAQRAAAARVAATPAPPAPAPAPAAVTGNTAGGVWAALRNCESGGNYAEDSGNGFYGAYQFSLATWRGLGYSGYPNQASASAQDAAAAQLQARSGWGQWPACSRRLGL